MCATKCPNCALVFLEGFGELFSPTCPRHAAEPPLLEVPAHAESGASFCFCGNRERQCLEASELERRITIANGGFWHTRLSERAKLINMHTRGRCCDGAKSVKRVSSPYKAIDAANSWLSEGAPPRYETPEEEAVSSVLRSSQWRRTSRPYTPTASECFLRRKKAVQKRLR